MARVPSTHLADGDVRILVAPFFRASVTIGSAGRQLFARDLDASSFLDLLRGSGGILRQNLRRLFASAVLAESSGGRLVFVEGWRGNRILRPTRPARVVTGSWIFRLGLRLLRCRGLVAVKAPPIHARLSRCTWEEAQGIASIADQFARRASVIGVTDTPCPSPARAARYVRSHGAGDCVMTPAQALARSCVCLSPEQAAFWAAVEPRAIETLAAPWIEAPNWVVHWLSSLTQALMGATPPLEQRLAARLRPDRE